MGQEICAEVNQEFWNDLKEGDPQEIVTRCGVLYEGGIYQLKFLDRTLTVDPVQQQVQVAGRPQGEPGLWVCLTALLYLLNINPARLGPRISPLELPGGSTFFRGPHKLPHAPLEERFGRDRAGFVAAGKKLQGKTRSAGDASVALEVFPGLIIEVILWQAEDDSPAQVSFTMPAHLDKFWFLDAVWGLLNLVTREMLQAA